MRRALAVLAASGCVLAGCATIGSRPSGSRPAPAAVRGSAAAVRPSAPAPVVVSMPPAPTPAPAAPAARCAGNSRPQLVQVSVAHQHMWMCAGTSLAHQTPVTTGIATEDYHTPAGHYVIQAKQMHQTLTLLTGDRYVVQYWIPFDAPLFGFHDAAWQTFPYGSPRYRTDGSHGCVHLPLAAVAWLYHWVHVGTPVLIS
jgi:hypothetical protein